MKLNKLFIIAFMLSAAIISCNNSGGGDSNKKEELTAKWKMTDISGKETEHLDDSTKQQMFKDASVEFKADGKYEMIGMGGGNKTGTWKFGSDDKTLITTEDGSMVVDTVTLVELKTGKLVVKDSKSDLTITFKSN